MCTRYPIINRVSELKVHIELTRFVQPEKIEIDANERAVNEKSPYCFFVCTTFDSFLNDLHCYFLFLVPSTPNISAITPSIWHTIICTQISIQSLSRHIAAPKIETPSNSKFAARRHPPTISSTEENVFFNIIDEMNMQIIGASEITRLMEIHGMHQPFGNHPLRIRPL